MKKKVFSLMMMCLFAFTGAYAQFIEVGSGNGTNTSLPTNTNWKYSLTQQIYTVAELGEADTLTGIAFYNASTAAQTRSIDLYLKEDAKVKFDSTKDWVAVTAANKVFSGEVVFAAEQWTVIPFDTPFAYTGTKNIVLTTDDNTGSYQGSTSFAVFDSTAMSLFKYRDSGGDLDPIHPQDTVSGVITTYAGTIGNVKNQVRFTTTSNVFCADLPTNSYYKYGVTQQIFKPEQFGSVASVGSVKFFNQGAERTRMIDIYMTPTTKETFADGNDWEVVDTLDLVFSGEVTFAANAWTKIMFDTVFEYDGLGNVVLTMDDNTDVAYAGLDFYVLDSANMAIAYHSDDTNRFNPDPTDLTGIAGTLLGVRNDVEFGSAVYELTVHDGTDLNEYIPMYGYYFDNSTTKSEFVLPAAELAAMNGGQIQGLKFYPESLGDYGSSWSSVQRIFIKEVASAELTAISGETGATVVFEGSLTLPVAGEPYEITFTTPYTYHGGNLLIGVYNTTAGGYKRVIWYGETVNNTSMGGYGTSYISQRNFLPKTTFVYEPGNVAPVVYDPNLYMFDMTDTTFVDTLFFGDRPNNAWMRPVDMYSLWNHTGSAINIVRFDFTPEDGFFTAEAVGFETPFTMNDGDTIPMLFTTNITDTTYADTTFMHQFVAVYDSRTAGVWPIMIHAYNPVCPDVFELAQFLDTIPALAVDSVKTYGPFTFNNPDTIYDNYELPYSDAPFFLEDGKDVVYKFVVEEGNEVMLNASVTGSNGKAVVYTEDFYGEPGPMADNFYAGPRLSSASRGNDVTLDPTCEYSPEPAVEVEGCRAAWDLVYSFQGNSAGQQGIATDGNFIYTASWQSTPSGGYSYYKYDLTGNFIEGFNITGASGVRDLTYDGQYFYGTSGGNKIFILDLANKSKVGEITCAGLTSRHISYDADRDAFWCGNWSTLALYNRSGALIQNGPAPSSAYGSAYFRDDAGVEHLYLFCQTGTSNKVKVYDYNITTNTLEATPVADLSSIPGYLSSGIAGGAFIANYAGKVCFFANIQQDPNLIGIYELKDIPAVASTDTYWAPNPEIQGLTLAAGTYYLVGSATSADFTVNIEFAGLPCPEAAVAVAPLDDADDLQPNMVTLQWELGNYTTQYRLKFGTTYYCEETLVDWTSDLAQSYNVYNLYNNTNYFWRVDEMNGNCVTEGDVWGFTTTFNIPQDLHAQDTSVFVGEDVVMEWTTIQDRTFRMYNIYLDGELIGSTTETPNPHTYYTFTIPADSLTYNMTPGYAVNVTALYDEGESPFSDTYILKVSGNGTLAGRVLEQDGTTGIAGATVTFTGVNEFGEEETYTATTGATGAYSIAAHACPAGSYIGRAECEGYQGPVTPSEGNPRRVTYNATTAANFMMDEEFYPVGNVWAEYYPDITSDDEYVKVYWSTAGTGGVGSELTVCDGTAYSSYVPCYGLWHDDYTRTETVYPADLLAPLAGTQITSLKYYIETPAYRSWDPASFNVYLMEVPNTTISSYYGSTNATVVYSGSLDGQGDEMFINFTTPYLYNGGNLLVGIEEPVTGTYASCYFYGIQSNGSSASGYSSSSLAGVAFNQRNFLPKTTFNASRGREMANEGGDRAFHHYRIYRTSCYNDGPYNSDNTVMLASDWPTDTVYIDTNFDTVSPGVYKWGVSCVYEGNRSVPYPNPNDRESEIVWSNCLDKDMWLDNVDVTVLLNSADSPEGTRVSFTNTNPTEQELYPMPTVILDESGFEPLVDFRRGEYEITVSKAGYETITETRTIWDETHLRYVMIEILYPISNLYVSRTGWAMWEPGTQGGGGGGAAGLIDFETGDFSQYAFDNTVSNYPWIVTNSQSYEGTYCMMSTNGGNNSTTSAIEATVDYSADGTVSFYANCMGEGSYTTAWDKCIFKIDGNTMLETGAQISGWNEYSYPVTAGSHVFRWEYTKDGSVHPTGDAMFVDNISFGGGRVREDRHLEGYKILCTAIDGEPIYNHNTINLEPFCQLATETTIGEPLVEGAHYICKVAAVYSTGTSAWTEAEWVYEPCDHWGPVDEVTVSTENDGNFIEWVFEHGYNPYGNDSLNPTPGPTPGAGQWYYYGDDVCSNNIGAGGAFYWGVMFPAGSYTGNMVTKVATYDDGYGFTGNVTIFNDGATAPANAVGTMDVTLAGNSSGMTEFEFATPVTIDPTKNLWVVFYNSTSTSYPAAACDDSGDPNGRWVSLDGSSWMDLATAGVPGYNFMVRAYVASGAKGEPQAISYEPKACKAGQLVATGRGNRSYYGGGDLETGMLATGLYAFNITDIDNFDERVYFVANLLNDDRFEVVLDKNHSLLLINTGKYHESEDLEANVNAFRAENAAEFAQMDKETAAATAMALKNQMPSEYVIAMMMDIYARSRENNLCALADPFCTDNGMYEFPAGVNAGTGESGPDYNCLYTTPNPAWYYMRIGNPGSIDIYMYSTPSVDIDFCCWGPFDDPETPCPYGLTGDKVVSCSYSAAPTEHCMIPASAQTGEYYILVITNYSNQACNINFSQVGGNGNTDCGILPPVDIIGFLITQDGEYLDIVGPTVREYTDLGEYGDHEYCVRPIYPGEMTLPDHNYGWSMGCPVCEFSNGEIVCQPGAPIDGEYYYDEGEFGAHIFWGINTPEPPAQGDEFTANFDGGMPTGWTTIDADGDGFGWMLGSQCDGTYLSGGNLAGAGHNSSADLMTSGSYSNIYGALTPDNFLVSPQVTIGDGSTFSFWACAQDASYAAEHFGVAVSTDGINYTMVQEWTMTAKEGAKAPRGMNAQGNWYQKTVDLSDYAGEECYIAIRHFNCTDMFMLNVDDIELSNGAKRDRADIIAYNVYRSTDNMNYTLIATVPAAYDEYYDEITPGTYYYQVTAVYDNDCESDPAPYVNDASQDYVIVEVTGIDDIDGKVALYPNPTNGLVKIEARGMRHITVVSTLGQVVYDTELRADEYELNMAQFSAGVYMVRIATESGVSTQRVTVVK